MKYDHSFLSWIDRSYAYGKEKSSKERKAYLKNLGDEDEENGQSLVTK